MCQSISILTRHLQGKHNTAQQCALLTSDRLFFVMRQMETLDYVFWFRQLIGLGMGLAAGVLHLSGVYVILGFWVTMFVLSNLYTTKVLNVCEEDFQNAELTMEGAANSFGLFLLTWIVCFSFF